MLNIMALYYPDCPSYEVLPDRLEQALRAGNVPAGVEHRVVTVEEGEQLGMRGSPTVLINGVDIVEGAAAGTT